MSQENATERSKVLFQDRFCDGRPELPWKPYPGFNLDNLAGEKDPASPGRTVGVLRNDNAGGFVALSYVVREVPRDFALDSWLHATVSEEPRGPLNGLAFRVDPAGERFYRVAADFAANPTLNLAYVGRDSRNMPVYLRKWSGDELSGGPPTHSGWHHLRIEVRNNHAEVFWDRVRLGGGPFELDKSPTGFVGVYANFVSNRRSAETRVADFRVEAV